MNLLARFKPHLNAARITLLRWGGIEVGQHVAVSGGVRVRRIMIGGDWGSVRIGDGCELRDGTVIESWGGNVVLHPRVFLGPYTVIYGHGGVEIGNETLIAMHCRILSSNHTVPPAGTDIRSQPDILQRTTIGRDVWLGAGVTVLGGVRIGDGCVVGAGAVVSKDLPAHSIALGVPARVVGERPQAE